MFRLFFLCFLASVIATCSLKRNASQTTEITQKTPAKINAECQQNASSAADANAQCIAPASYNIDTQKFSVAAEASPAFNLGNGSSVLGVSSISMIFNFSSHYEVDILDCTCEATRSDGIFVYIVSQSIAANHVTFKDIVYERSKIDLFLEGRKYATACFNKASPILEKFVKNGSSKWFSIRSSIPGDPDFNGALKNAFCSSGVQVCIDAKKDGTWRCHDRDKSAEFSDPIMSYFPLRTKESH